MLGEIGRNEISGATTVADNGGQPSDSVSVILVLGGDTAKNSIQLLSEWGESRSKVVDRDIQFYVVLAGVSEAHASAVAQHLARMNGAQPDVVLRCKRASFPEGVRTALEADGSNLGRWTILWPGWARPEIEWLGGLTAELREDAPRFVQPLVVQRDGTIASAGGVVNADGSVSPHLRGLPVEDATRPHQLVASVPLGPIVALRSADLVIANGLGERYTQGLAEVDLALRLSRGGDAAVRIAHESRVLGRAQRSYGFPGDRASAVKLLTSDHSAQMRSLARRKRTSTKTTRPTPRSAVPRLRWAIDTAVPGDRRRRGWGDWIFAQSLARALERLGQDVSVDTKASRRRDSRRYDDVVIVLRGLDRVTPVAGAVNLLWVISHPDAVTADEIDGFDAAFAAGQGWSPAGDKPAKQIRPLLQCTDPEIFNPGRASAEHHHRLVFVGNSRNTERPMITGAASAGLEPVIYGRGWQPHVDPSRIAGEFLDQVQVGEVYASSDFVLVDHWPDMREHGFVSNRLFDVLASGSVPVTDDVSGLQHLGVAGAFVVRDTQDWDALRGAQPDDFQSAEQRNLQATRIAEEHSFDARAKVLLATALEIGANRRRSAQLSRVSRQPMRRPKPLVRRVAQQAMTQVSRMRRLGLRKLTVLALLALIAVAAAVQALTERWEATVLLVTTWLLASMSSLIMRQNRALQRRLRRLSTAMRSIDDLPAALTALDRSQRHLSAELPRIGSQVTRAERQLAESDHELSSQLAAVSAELRGLSTIVSRNAAAAETAWDRLESRLDSICAEQASSASGGQGRRQPASKDTSEVVGQSLIVNVATDGLHPCVNLVLDSFTPKQIFAGVLTALHAGMVAAKRTGRPLRLFVLRQPREATEQTRSELSQWLSEHGFPAEAAGSVEVVSPANPEAHVNPDDIWIATYWATATALSHAVARGVTSPARVIYLVQDWEPAFFAWGTEHSLAFDTYLSGFRMVVNSTPLARFLENQTGVAVPQQLVFAPQLDMDRLHAAADAWSPADPLRPRVLFYARPSKPRNLYALGLDALRTWSARLPRDVRPTILLAGEDSPAVDLGDRMDVHRLGKLTADEYFDLLQRIDIGMALMHSPHPSHLPLELPAAGIPTVTNALGDYRAAWVDGLHVAAAQPGALAAALDSCLSEASRLREHRGRDLPEGLGVSLDQAIAAAVASVLERM